MIDLTRCGAVENRGGLPAVMAQGNVSSYQTMIESDLPRGEVREMKNAPQPNGAGQGTYEIVSDPQQGLGMAQGGTDYAESLGPLPSGSAGMSAAEQILHSSWKSMMSRNLGRSVVVSFLIGTQGTIVARGVLYEVGSDYIALYQPQTQSYISADLYSIRFMEFLPESGNDAVRG